MQGPRSSLAQELMRAQKFQAPVAMVANAGAIVMPAQSATVSAGDKPAAGEKKNKRSANYRVRPGDSLAAIAREHSCDVGVLAKENRLKSPGYLIKPGQRIKLQGCAD